MTTIPTPPLVYSWAATGVNVTMHMVAGTPAQRAAWSALFAMLLAAPGARNTTAHVGPIHAGGDHDTGAHPLAEEGGALT